MALSIIQNQTGYVNPTVAILDTGWTITGIYAAHVSCNAGFIKSKTSLNLEVGRNYTITYTVDNYVNGGVYVKVGDNVGATRTAAGTYTEVLTCTGTPSLSFFSDGTLRISILKFYDVQAGTDEGTTITFHEKSNTWGSERSYKPELMIKFIDKFFCMKNGQMWQQDVNPVRNNFFGQQYNSLVQFYDNINPTTVKLYFSIRVQGNSRWFSPNTGDIVIVPVEGRSLGMKSRLKKGNFKNYQGSYFADFLRNGIDTRFDDELQALFKGEPLRGRVLDVTMINEETTEALLFEIDIKSASSSYTY